jgi:Domain of unknown function (DUF1844)
MTDSESKINANFFQLVLSLQIAAVQQMGKIVSPISGKIERNLNQAKASIDMLEMLSEKTRNNLSKEEEQFLSNILFELRMNYVDECRKTEPPPEKQSDDKPEEKS